MSQASQNAKTLIGGTLKSLAQSVSDYGKLMVNIIIQHLTAPEFEEITDKIKYRNFIVQEQVVGGKKVSKRIRFDEAIANMSPEEVKNYQMSLLKESGYPDSKEHIYVVNPFLWSKLKYMIRVEADALLPKNKEFEKMIAERLYTLLRQDPLANPEALLRDLLNTNNKNSDELMAKQIPNVMNPQSQKASPPSSATPGMTPMPSMLTA